MNTELHISVREGRAADVPVVLDLIRELAAYERAADQVELTAEQLEADGFGAKPRFSLLVAELDGEVVGMALLYPRYSTWKGATLYLEDLVVSEAHRGKGIGTALFTAIQRFALNEKAQRLEWQVLDWNKSAIAFYEKIGASLDHEWVNCRLIPSEMEANLNAT